MCESYNGGGIHFDGVVSRLIFYYKTISRWIQLLANGLVNGYLAFY